MTARINNWSGRTGNNLIQIINCLYYSFYKHNLNSITFPSHSLFKTTKILSKENKNLDNSKKIHTDKSNFFYAKKLGFVLCPKKMREISQKYLIDIVNINLNETCINNSFYIHLRGGDTFTSKNLNFISMPWKYYKYILDNNNYENLIVVHEDNNNSCLDKFKELKNAKTQSKTLLEDIELLCQAKRFIFTVSTFDIMIFCLSKNIEEIFIPHTIVDEEWFPDMNWGVKTNIVYLENYTKNIWLGLDLKQKKELLLNYNEKVYFK